MHGGRWIGAVVLVVAGALCVTTTADASPFVYVMGRTSGTSRINVLTVIDAATNTVSTQIPLGTANSFILPQLMVMSPDGSRVYVGNDLESTISVVSTASHLVVDTWPTSVVGPSPRALAISPDGRRLYLSRQNGSVAAIDTTTRSLVADLALGLGSVFGLAASPDGSRVYAMAANTDQLGSPLAILSAAPFRLLTTINLALPDVLLRADAIEVSPDGRFLYIPERPSWDDPCINSTCLPVVPPASADPTRVAVMDTSTHNVIATTRIRPKSSLATVRDVFFTKIYHMAVSPNGQFVYTIGRTSIDNTPLYRLSPSTHEEIGAVRLGAGNPTGRAITFLADSSRAYVATNDGIYVVDTSSHAASTFVAFSAATDGIPNAIVTTPPPPPEPPSNLRATVTGNRVSLTWNAPAAGAVSEYLLEGGASPGSVLASISTGQSTPGFTFDAPSGAFYIRIHAFGTGRRSTASNEIQILVNVPRPPSTPTNLRGLSNGADLALSWTNTTSGGAPSSLVLDVSGAVSASLPLPVAESFSFAGVPPGTYTFTMRATNATGISAASLPVTLSFPGTCPGAPQAPTNFTAARSGAQLTVSWEPPSGGAAVTGYVLQVRGAVNLSLPMTARTISGAVPVGTYQLSVQAWNPCGTGPLTASQAISVP